MRVGGRRALFRESPHCSRQPAYGILSILIIFCVALVSGADHPDSLSEVARRTVTIRVESAWHRSVKDDSASLSTMRSLATPARDARSHSSVSPRLAASLAPR